MHWLTGDHGGLFASQTIDFLGKRLHFQFLSLPIYKIVIAALKLCKSDSLLAEYS